MKKAERILDALGKIDDKYVVEAYSYKQKRPVSKQKIRYLIAACILFCMIPIFTYGNLNQSSAATIYTYGTNEQIERDTPVLMQGEISDSGEMKGHPLQFYVLGNRIEKIRFSCKNESISFVDWTEKRGDYGYSKNFTVNYGEDEDDYFYLVVDWTPNRIIRRLTDNADVTISDLSEEERKDIIVLEITYLTGRTETLAIFVELQDDGKFMAKIQKYQIKNEDDFVYGEEKIEKESEISSSGTNEMNQNKSKDTLEQTDLSRIEEIIKNYYEGLRYEVIEIVPLYDAADFHDMDYAGYASEEVVVFKVTIKESEVHRYIVIGTKNNWHDCSVLNEGY